MFWIPVVMVLCPYPIYKYVSLHDMSLYDTIKASIHLITF